MAEVEGDKHLAEVWGDTQQQEGAVGVWGNTPAVGGIHAVGGTHAVGGKLAEEDIWPEEGSLLVVAWDVVGNN